MTDAQERGPDVAAMRRAIRRAALLTAGAGIGYGVLSIIAWLLLEQDRQRFLVASDPYEYYAESDLGGATIAGLYLLPFAAILFLWFIVALRGWIRGTQTRRNMLISDLQLVSGVVFISLFLVGAGALAAAVVVEQGDIDATAISSLQVLTSFGHALMDVMGVRLAAVFVIATASLGMTTSALPRWFNSLSYGFGIILMITPVVEQAFILAFPIWVIVLSVMMLYHIANVPEDELPGFAMRYADGNTQD